MRSLIELEKDLSSAKNALDILGERNKGSSVLSDEINIIQGKIKRLQNNINQRKQKDLLQKPIH
jgi:hypothetical protein